MIDCQVEDRFKLNIRDEDGHTLSFLALGDSYTIGESVLENERWPVQLVDSLKKRGIKVQDPVIVATTGWRTDELKEAMRSLDRYDFDIVSLLIGVNNQYQGRSAKDFGQEFEDLLQLAIERANGVRKRVFVFSIPDYGFTPFGKGDQPRITEELDKYNRVNKQITDHCGIRYFDITPISRGGLDDPGLVAADGLHPSGKQYALWVAEILKDEEFVKDLKGRRN